MNAHLLKAWMLGIAGILVLSASVQKQAADQQYSTDRLKATPVASIESGMPETALHQWLSENTHGESIQYVIESCSQKIRGSYPADSVCITASLGGGWVVLRFIDMDPKKGDRCVSCRFVNGQEGPPQGSSMKRPTRFIRKLRDLCTLLSWKC